MQPNPSDYAAICLPMGRPGNDANLGTHASSVLFPEDHEEHAGSVRTQESSEEREKNNQRRRL
jgi:hypothetical protein